ncbi:HD domain-containing protein [Bacillus subtilis]|uniref:3'-5' exoribonuclease YhaM family protein n=1 Tax=Bacillus subtilis TaxID=1423 RepID=UPI0020268DD0|nr:HD domain-containing protein [Bacillus subtilis]MCL9628307.1 HD domain-containing protein [Bacillus subtilis]
MGKTMIENLLADGMGKRVKFKAMVKSCDKKVASNQSTYLDLILSDRSGEIIAKKWSATDSDVQFFESAKYIGIAGDLGEYRGKPQMTITNFKELGQDEIDVSEFIKTAPESEVSLIQEYEGFLDKISDDAIREISWTVYSKFADKFKIFPAAKKMHHAYINGLIYHTVSMLRLAEHNHKQYGDTVNVDMDIVYGAIALHDVAKVVEYSDPFQPEFTDLGTKVGHIVLAAMEIRLALEDLIRKKPGIDTSKVYDLIHAVLAHHGKKEWGSPVEPKTKEAGLVHQIDLMDATINQQG